LIDSGLISLALLVATALVAGYFAYVYNLKRQAYLLYWTAGWSTLALHYLGSGLSSGAGANTVQTAISQGIFAGAGIFFFLGARQYAHRTLMSRAAMGVGAAVLAWTIANALGVFPFPVVFLAFAIYSAVGVEFWVESRLQETLADWLLSVVFFAWASLGLIFYFLQARLDALHVALDPISALPATFAAMLACCRKRWTGFWAWCVCRLARCF
jgi:hypothetical protein